MPNLKPWIEAQLKRGYSKSQIKKVLVKKGYPLNAVAEVDEVRYAASSAKTLPSGKIIKKFSSKKATLLAVIAVVIVVLFFLNKPTDLDQSQSQIEEAETEPDETNKIEFNTFKTSNKGYNVPKEIQRHFDMCDSFKEFNDSVKCFTAIQKVLGGYEGTVISVNRTTIVFPTARSISPSNVWLVEMKLDDPIPALPGELRYEIEIAVNRNTGVVKPYRIIQ